MFYNNHEVSFELLNVIHLKRYAEKDQFIYHRKHTGIGYRISGSTVFEFDGKKVVANAGSVTYIPEEAKFIRSSTSEEAIFVHMKCHGIEEKEIQLFTPGDDVRLSRYFFEMVRAWEQCRPGYKHRCTSLLYKILEEIEAYASNNPTNKKEHTIKNSLLYMNMYFDDPQITIAEIAKHSNVSEAYFRKLYKEVFGISPCIAIQNMRIQRASQLLQSGYFSITEVAQKSGFENCKYFSTLFRKKVGKTPSEYLRDYQKGYQ